MVQIAAIGKTSDKTDIVNLVSTLTQEIMTIKTELQKYKAETHQKLEFLPKSVATAQGRITTQRALPVFKKKPHSNRNKNKEAGPQDCPKGS